MKEYNHWKKDQHKWTLPDYDFQEKRSTIVQNILVGTFILLLGILIGGLLYV